jgi:hypothetical protein
MKNIKNRNSEVWWRLRGAVLLALAAGLGFAGALASCGQIVDPENDPDDHHTATETNVKNFYYKIEDKGAQYRYALSSQNAYLPSNDVLIMNMQGNDGYEKWHGMQVCVCDWAYEQDSSGEPWYYAMSQDSIVALGVDYNGYTDSWVELKAPLKLNATWDFVSQKENIHATIEKYGVSATVGGKTFKDVIVVDFKGDKGTDGTTWYQRDTGVIYSHIARPGNSLVDLQFKSMKD